MKEYLALEGFSRSLSREILPRWNIKVSNVQLRPLPFDERLDQICTLQIGSFDTNGFRNALILQESPEYNDETSPFTALRRILTAPGFRFEGDPNKLAKAIYSLIQSGHIPSHLPLGQDALMVAREVAELREQEITGAAPWSTDLLRDDL